MQTETVTAAMQELAPEIRRLHARDLASISRRFDVDDLVQTTALKAISAAANCQADSLEQLRHWVLSIARRTTKSAIFHEVCVEKRSVRRETADAELIAQSLSEEADNALEAAELAQRQLDWTLQRLEELPPRQAMAIKLRYLQELEYQEIAHRMNATPWAVRCLVCRGLSRLRTAS